MVCDFDIMMQKKKEENRALQNKRRKAKDIDMINDNDDAIAKVLNTSVGSEPKLGSVLARAFGEKSLAQIGSQCLAKSSARLAIF